MAWIATGMIVGGGMNYMASRSSSKRQAQAQRETNDANARMAQMANEMEMERYFQSRGAAMGATYEELTARPGDENYNSQLSMFNEDGSAKTSAVLPLYLSDMEKELGANIEDKYGAITEAYDPMGEYKKVQGIRDGLAGAEAGMVSTVNDVFSGQELNNTNSYLDSILDTRMSGIQGINTASANALANKSGARFAGAEGVAGARFTGAGEVGSARQSGTEGMADARFDGSANVGDARLTGANLNITSRMMGLGEVQDARNSISQAEAQAILNEGQRNAARADFTGRSGIVGASGNSQAQTLAALMNAYTNAGVNSANNRLMNAQDASDVYLANAQDLGGAYIDNAMDYRTDLVSSAEDRKADGVATAQDYDTARVSNAEDLNKIYLNNATDAEKIMVNTAQDRAKVLEQGALEKFAAYENNLQDRKNVGQVGNVLNAISNNATVGLDNMYAPEKLASSALSAAGMQIGTGRAPEANVPAYTAPVKGSGWQDAAAGVQGALSGAMLANSLAGSFGSSSSPTYKPGWDKASTQAAFDALPGPS